ncbi:hypothetical protein [Collimonas sp.]|jgi:hypothetical protein|uniref:hypothetical protein n=1 Tax=Collimonas sp. TaxID=1963772 RepID=UPI002B5A5C2B|nr:hypothetical protein [Collimonas sp.]HWW04405.1 hypothetical protein [Collimonas sp.]
MKHILIGILVASAVTAPVLAHDSGSGSGSGAGPTTTSTSTATAAGGAGGSGGSAAGGTAAGGTASNTISGTYGASATNGGSATGGSGTGGNSTVSVSVSLPNSGTSGSGTGTGSGASGTSAGTGTGASAAAGDPGSSPNNTKTTVDYGGSYSVKTVPNIVAPSLTTTLSDTCMGSASFGLSFTGFGATGGTTMVDQACVRRLDSREFRAMGLNDVALALLCQSEANRKAVESTGRSCPGMERAAAPGAPAAPAAPSASSTGVIGQNIDTIGDQYKDPVIRARLGLDKLSDISTLKDH